MDKVKPASDTLVNVWRKMIAEGSKHPSRSWITNEALNMFIARIDSDSEKISEKINEEIRFNAMGEEIVLGLVGQVKGLKKELAKLRSALNAVFLDAIQCETRETATETTQYFMTEWAMDKVREALKETK